ncbi:MAG: hypothetical protein RPU13_07555 [Candidatus Sedimenticola sp. (ex Thyasira tokunagai)]
MNGKERSKAFNKARREQLKTAVRLRKDTHAEIVRLLNQAEAQIKETLNNAPTDYEKWYLPQLQQQVSNALKGIEAETVQQVSHGVSQSWQMGLDLVDKPIAAGGVQLAAMLPQVNTQQLMAMRAFSTDKIKDVSVSLINKINSELGLVTIGAQPVGNAVSNIQRLFDKQGRSRALTIVRTNLGQAFSVATQKRQRQASEVLPGLQKQWRRSGKVHSRLEHDTIDGDIVPVDESFTLGNGVTLLHPRDPKAPAAEVINCGCESLPWMEHWEVKHPGKKP